MKDGGEVAKGVHLILNWNVNWNARYKVSGDLWMMLRFFAEFFAEAEDLPALPEEVASEAS